MPPRRKAGSPGPVALDGEAPGGPSDQGASRRGAPTFGEVKKAIAALKLKPAEKKGVCNLYAPADVARVKKALAGA